MLFVVIFPPIVEAPETERIETPEILPVVIKFPVTVKFLLDAVTVPTDTLVAVSVAF